jgi:hypothetical protein
MSTDPILDELHRLRAEQMALFNFDFEAFYRDLKEQEKLSPRPIHSTPESLRKTLHLKPGTDPE